MIPAPGSDAAPKYWRDEITGRLEAPIMRYLENEPLSGDDVMLIRLYLEQWIDSPVWDLNPTMQDETRRKLVQLRKSARTIKTRKDIDGWIQDGLDLGIDPL